jgi:hypothetical protein
MKKLLIVLAIGTFAACNSGTESTTTTDSTVIDSTVVALIQLNYDGGS